jgi:hypothetical protein
MDYWDMNYGTVQSSLYSRVVVGHYMYLRHKLWVYHVQYVYVTIGIKRGTQKEPGLIHNYVPPCTV